MANAEWEAEFEAHRFDDEAQFQREEERRENDGPEERATRDLVDAFRGSFCTEGMDLSELTASLLRTIGNSYQSSVERRLSVGLDDMPAIKRLRVAMDAYAIVFPESEEALFGPSECPF